MAFLALEIKYYFEFCGTIAHTKAVRTSLALTAFLSFIEPVIEASTETWLDSERHTLKEY